MRQYCLRSLNKNVLDKPLGFLLLMLLAMACNKNDLENNPLLAEVGSNKFYLNDIPNSVSTNFKNKEDSVAYINQAIEAWVREKLILEKVSLTDQDQKEINNLVQDYKSNLERVRFEENWLAERLDTNFVQAEIDSFIARNPSMFEQEGEWIKCTFAKVNGTIPGLTEFEKNWSEENIEEVRVFCDKFAALKHLDKNIWVTKSSIQSLVPKGAFKDGTFDLKGYTQRSHKNYEYFLTIYKLKTGNSLPEELQHKKARNILLQKQKLQLLKAHRDELYNKALKEKKVRYYLDKVI